MLRVRRGRDSNVKFIPPGPDPKAFRGKLPDPEAMLKKKGLAMVTEPVGSDA